ncbi:ankyrin repeat domain-containing protein [Candidatus Vondammii sp. HM_W22]|uniref:ankyrin repeat domain-containing protein n=1 Tax=Candidatus Vondammii sp. HM_W22 TaxID=2687299 RepID=UPI001F140F11|nr:ankyrin repeat domain-containing protein [Candidatus Vondammii sp. HM_W22]
MVLISREFKRDNTPRKGNELADIPDDVIDFLYAAKMGYMDALEDGIQNCDLNATDETGMTALHHAAVNYRDRAVDRLLEEIPNGLDAGIEDNFDRDPAWIMLSMFGQESEKAKKMYDKLSPFVYPIADEDIVLEASDAPEI